MKTSVAVLAASAILCVPAWGEPAQPAPVPAPVPAAGAPAVAPAPVPAPAVEPVPVAPKGEALLQADLEKLVERLVAVQSLESFDAREELLEVGRASVDALTKAAKDKRPEMRHLACELLGDIRDAKAVPVLLEALADKDEFGTSVASVAARALGRIGDRAVIPQLAKALESPDRDLRYEAARTLGILRADEAKAAIRKLLKDQGETAHHRLIRCAAAEAAGRLRDGEALEDLGTMLSDETMERRTERRVKLYAALALDRIMQAGKGNLRGSDKERDDAVKAWADWWKKRNAKPEAEPPKPAAGAAPVEKSATPAPATLPVEKKPDAPKADEKKPDAKQ